MSEYHWLQLFAEGDGEGTGETAPDAGEELRALGVPEEKIRKRAGQTAGRRQQTADAPQPQPEPEAAQQEQDAAAEEQKNGPGRMTWEEIMKDPEYNGRMQQVVRDRLRESRGARDNLRALEPALELLADRYHLDAGNLDAAALAKAITEDNAFYEQQAEALGVSPETARRMDQMERFERRQRQQQEEDQRQQAAREHIRGLVQQEAAMRELVPDFDLRRELENPTFARLTAPGVGISVQDAYFAVHRKEMQEQIQRQATQETAQKLAASIQANQGRPRENGTSAQAQSTGQVDYRHMPRQQREELKERIRMAAARGEKVYPT